MCVFAGGKCKQRCSLYFKHVFYVHIDTVHSSGGKCLHSERMVRCSSLPYQLLETSHDINCQVVTPTALYDQNAVYVRSAGA